MPADPGSTSTLPPTTTTTKAEAWKTAKWTELPGWAQYPSAQWLKAFAQQCEGGKELGKNRPQTAALTEQCKRTESWLKSQPALTNEQARNYITQHFAVWQAIKEDGSPQGLLTGYFEPLLQGARKRGGQYQHPLYATPNDLIVVDLGALYPELEGKRVRGRLEGNKLVPYYDRQTWEALAPQREKPLVWVDDALDAFLLQVQGSGRVTLSNGETLRLSYADQNGHPYKAIGKVLVQRGELSTEQATIPGIRAWAEKNPSKLAELLNQNPSVVFFSENTKLNPQQGPVGAMGQPLTPDLSLAVDRKRIPYGSPVWIASTHPISGKPLEQGMLAQDTGGAITGRVRADYYWGTGKSAGQAAGLTRQPFQLWLLWPKGEQPPAAD